MIRVVVVDDDFRIAGIHASYVNKVDGFAAIAQAHTAAEAVAVVDRLRPDLLLLDLYLPDEHGPRPGLRRAPRAGSADRRQGPLPAHARGRRAAVRLRRPGAVRD
ncbi:MAG TPA: response regulator, partial [Streptosporangiaceae bacterium]|nr:response regulator [Streptosporangiaceae bacterium]